MASLARGNWVVELRVWYVDPVGCRIGPLDGSGSGALEGARVARADLAGAAHLELVSGVVQLRPEEAMFEALCRARHNASYADHAVMPIWC